MPDILSIFSPNQTRKARPERTSGSTSVLKMQKKVYTGRDVTRSEGWQPSRVVAYVKIDQPLINNFVKQPPAKLRPVETFRKLSMTSYFGCFASMETRLHAKRLFFLGGFESDVPMPPCCQSSYAGGAHTTSNLRRTLAIQSSPCHCPTDR